MKVLALTMTSAMAQFPWQGQNGGMWLWQPLTGLMNWPQRWFGRGGQQAQQGPWGSQMQWQSGWQSGWQGQPRGQPQNQWQNPVQNQRRGPNQPPRGQRQSPIQQPQWLRQTQNQPQYPNQQRQQQQQRMQRRQNQNQNPNQQQPWQRRQNQNQNQQQPWQRRQNQNGTTYPQQQQQMRQNGQNGTCNTSVQASFFTQVYNFMGSSTHNAAQIQALIASARTFTNVSPLASKLASFVSNRSADKAIMKILSDNGITQKWQKTYKRIAQCFMRFMAVQAMSQTLVNDLGRLDVSVQTDSDDDDDKVSGLYHQIQRLVKQSKNGGSQVQQGVVTIQQQLCGLGYTSQHD